MGGRPMGAPNLKLVSYRCNGSVTFASAAALFQPPKFLVDCIHQLNPQSEADNRIRSNTESRSAVSAFRFPPVLPLRLCP